MKSRIVEHLGADSLDIMGLGMALEEKFNIHTPEEAAKKISTVRDIVKYISTCR